MVLMQSLLGINLMPSKPKTPTFCFSPSVPISHTRTFRVSDIYALCLCVPVSPHLSVLAFSAILILKLPCGFSDTESSSQANHWDKRLTYRKARLEVILGYLQADFSSCSYP